MDKKYLQLAIELADENMTKRGGPFAAVIVKNKKIVAQSGNLVTQTNDPTAHAEITTIRKACEALSTYDLSGCIIYTSCEPCPMCLSAIWWARITEIIYAANKIDAAEAGFDDSIHYIEMSLPEKERKTSSQQLLHLEGKHVFENWNNNPDKLSY